MIGKSFGDRISPQEVQMRKRQIERALAGEQGHLESRTVRKDGTYIDAELRYLPIMHRGEPHVLAVARDITSRREAEARRRELEDQVRQAQKMEAIGQLTGGIAHDFNNILTSVIGYLAMGEERAAEAGDPHLVRQLDQAHLAARRARDLIAQMLTFARRQRSERRVDRADRRGQPVGAAAAGDHAVVDDHRRRRAGRVAARRGRRRADRAGAVQPLHQRAGCGQGERAHPGQPA